MNPFHLAIPVNNLVNCESFYCNILGCKKGRRDEKWVDLNFFGHQLVLHEKPIDLSSKGPVSNSVDGHNVPVPHFGVVLQWEEWVLLSEKLKTLNQSFIIEPYIRFKGEVGEQATMFLLDPENNALEFKAFKSIDQLFEY